MLSSGERLLYVEELRPPEGYRLDRAIATTYSLDLLCLLMVPLAMALSECQAEEDMLRDQTAVLEALRRTTGRMAIFCQQAQISVPRSQSVLFNLLEPVVVEARADDPRGVFHPKTWLLRFAADDAPTVYRMLCLSRNLTFDRSWDTLLTLEGVLEEREYGFGRNRPLADFVRALPALAASTVAPAIGEHVDLISEEVRKVRFDPPEGFENHLRFIPSGIAGHRRPPAFGGHSRRLVVSPFLTDKWLECLCQAESDAGNVLVSRMESLDAIGEKTFERVVGTTRIFVMDDGAEGPDDVVKEEAAAADPRLPIALSGLHAKLYIAHDQGWNARVITGSANATSAAFRGRNVEFQVELAGKRSRVGIDSLLARDEHSHSWGALLREYTRNAGPSHGDTIQRELESALSLARRAVAEGGLSLDVSAEDGGTYSMRVDASCPIGLGTREVTGCCYPISLRAFAAQDIAPLFADQSVTFSNISIEALTSFLAVELTARCESREAQVAFVLNLPLTGMPSDRDRRILRSIIRDRAGFVRYLLFLLSEDSDRPEWQALLLTAAGDQSERPATEDDYSLPLLEELVRAYSRSPEKIDGIARLVDDLTASGEECDLLPRGFERVWEAFRAARRREVTD